MAPKLFENDPKGHCLQQGAGCRLPSELVTMHTQHAQGVLEIDSTRNNDVRWASPKQSEKREVLRVSEI